MAIVVHGRFIWDGPHPGSIREPISQGLGAVSNGKVIPLTELIGKTYRIEKFNDTLGLLLEEVGNESPECVSNLVECMGCKNKFPWEKMRQFDSEIDHHNARWVDLCPKCLDLVCTTLGYAKPYPWEKE